ncbi:MAG TPA: CARDB domain-containing protein [Gemmatimonadales bacterium]|nr:CARDB domain-containing protein [Gemmatimonadales bacterium]
MKVLRAVLLSCGVPLVVAACGKDEPSGPQGQPGEGIQELNYSNNSGYVVFHVGTPAIEGPDLVIEEVTSPQHHVESPSGSWEVPFRVINMGSAVPAGSSAVAAYLSPDPTYSADDRFLAEAPVGTIASGAYQSGVITVAMPGGYSVGRYLYVLLLADFGDAVAELNEAANTSSFSVYVGTPSGGLADLVVEGMSLPTQHNLLPGESSNIQFRIHNMGQSPSAASKAKIYLSRDKSISTDDLELAEVDVSPLGPGAFRNYDQRFTVPSGYANGYYYIIVEANSR